MPAFRSKILVPKDEEMKTVRSVLKEVGLRNVIAQTMKGHIGPS
jgi:hypothetical protein